MRTYFQKVSKLRLGRGRQKRIKALLPVLWNHHSWNALEIPVSIRPLIAVSAMTWYCCMCEVQNSQHLEKCKVCQKHWSQVWTAPKKKNRSRSKSQKQQKQDNPDKSQQEGQWQVFQEKVPWVPTTPARSVAAKMEGLAEKEKESNLQPQQGTLMPLQPSKDLQTEGLTPAETKVLDHLRGLQGMGMALTPQMECQLQQLGEKGGKINSAKTLSHSHINRLKKLQGQVEGSAKRIKSLDQEWQAFVNGTMERIKEHGVMFQKCRSDLLEAHNQKLSELYALKEEMSQASRSLVGQQEPDWQAEDLPDVSETVQALQAALVENGPVDLTEEPMDDDEELLQEGTVQMETEVKKDVPAALRPFRAGASPTGVAKNHLKHKPAKEKDHKSKEESQA